MTTLLTVLLLAVVPGAATGSRPASSRTLSPAETQIQAARARIEAGHAEAKSYNALAAALTRRARESGDVSYYDRAIEALGSAERIDPANAETLRISAWVRMGRHEFAEAYRITRRYARTHPNDDHNLSVMGDALMELGRYGEAERTYQKMIDLRPGPTSWARVAYLREVTGDLEGAEEMMRMALAATEAREAEDRAWLLVQIGHLRDVMGDADAAGENYHAALDSFPRYHYALAALAELALRSGRAAEAVDLARKAIEAAPHAERYLILADALRAQGRGSEADAAEHLFEALATANIGRNDNENHDLVLFYLERRPDLDRALEIARLEAKRRQDIHTQDRLALALQRTGRRREARRLLERVRAIGTRDPLITGHAREIVQ